MKDTKETITETSLQDKKQRAAYTREAVKSITLEFMAKYKYQYLLMILTIIGAAILGMQPSLMTKRIMDEALLTGDTSMLIKLVLCTLGIIVAYQLVSLLSEYLNALISKRVIGDLKKDMYSNLIHMDHEFFATHSQGEIMTHMDADIQGVSKIITGLLEKYLSNFATIITTLIAMFSMNWMVALIGVALIPIMIIPSRLVGTVQKRLTREKQKNNDQVNQIITDTMSEKASMFIKQCGLEDQKEEQFNQINQDTIAIGVKVDAFESILYVLLDAITQIAPLAIYLVGGLVLVNEPSMDLTVGTITAMVALLNRLSKPVQRALRFVVSIRQSGPMFERVYDYLNQRASIKNTETPLKPDLKGSGIRFSHVDFGYDDNQKVLEDLSFDIHPGEVVALVGSTGCGKSTIAKLMMRIYDVWDGSIMEGEEDIRKLDLQWLREHTGYADQEGMVLSGTIRENLTFMKNDATQEELDEICRMVGLYDYIQSLPKGYDTLIGPKKLSLSAGNLERLTVARALLKNPEFLILDEATEELDAAEGNKLQSRIIEHMKHRTLLIITQQKGVAEMADRILVMHQGKIVDSGTFEELTGRDGVFRNLFGS